MAGMREIRERIASVSEIMKITNAMYLISSSNLKKAKKRLENTEPYFEKLQSTIHHILLHTPEFEHKYFDQREEKKPEDKMIGYIVVTADKGLAGAYNHNVLKLAEQEMAKHKNTCLFVVGQIGRHYFSRKNVTIDAEFLYTAQNPTLYRARAIAETVTDLFERKYLDQNGKNDGCDIAKNVGGILGAEWANLKLVFTNRNVAHFHAFHFHIRFPPFSSSAPSCQQPAASTPDSGRSYRKRTGQAWKPMPWMP